MGNQLKRTSKSLGGDIISTPESLGNAVRSARLQAGLTQEQAADLCNVGRKFIIALEQGRKGLSLDLVLQVLKSFGLVLTISPRKL